MNIRFRVGVAGPRSKQSVRRAQGLDLLEARHLMAAATGPFGLTDSSFGTAGHAIAAPTTSAAVQQLIVGPDNKYYAGGVDGIARFTAAGKADKTFGGDGHADLLGGSFVAEAVDSSDRVYALVQAGENTALIRYTAAGAVDTAYGTNGTALVVADANFTPRALAIGADNKPVVAGTESLNNSKDLQMRVLRVGTDGSLDSGFGSGGSFSATLGLPNVLKPDYIDGVAGVAVLSDGSILVGGGSYIYDYNSNDRSVPQFAVAKITTGGALDSSYGSGGIARKNYATSDLTEALPSAFAVASSGQTYLAIGDQNPELIVGSFNSTGGAVYDRQFTPDPIGSDVLEGLSVLPDGRAVLLSQAYDSNTGLALTPLSTAGVAGATVVTDDLDTSTTDIGGGTGAIATTPTGQIIVGGVASGGLGFELQQFLPGSASDPAPNAFANAGDNSIVYGPDGQIHVAYYDTADRDLMYVRRQRNGLWTTPVTLDAKPGAGTYVSIAVDSHSNPSIAYYDSRSKTLKFVSSADKGKHFSASLIDASADVGQYASLFVDPTTARPSIAYYDKTNGDLKFATLNSKKKWALSVIDSKGDVGRSASLHATVAGRLGIAYVDSTRGYVKFANTDKNGTFNVQNAARAAKGAENLSWVSDFYYSPAIYYHDLGTGEVRVATYPYGGGQFSTQTVANSGGQGVAAVQQAYGYAAEPVYVYSKSAKKVTLIQNALDTPTLATAVTGGGAYLNVIEASDVTIASYVDASGELIVAPIAELA